MCWVCSRIHARGVSLNANLWSILKRKLCKRNATLLCEWNTLGKSLTVLRYTFFVRAYYTYKRRRACIILRRSYSARARRFLITPTLKTSPLCVSRNNGCFNKNIIMLFRPPFSEMTVPELIQILQTYAREKFSIYYDDLHLFSLWREFLCNALKWLTCWKFFDPFTSSTWIPLPIINSSHRYRITTGRVISDVRSFSWRKFIFRSSVVRYRRRESE